jgi:threonine/homoserine/homoserine lactone efflux protein
VLLIVLGLKSLLGSPDPDASPPGWLQSLDNSSPSRAFALGMALFPLQVKNLAIFIACLNLIIASNLGIQGGVVALVLLIFALPVLALTGLYAATPQRASSMLESLQAWMGKHNRAITVVVCFVFGTFFLVRGVMGA